MYSWAKNKAEGTLSAGLVDSYEGHNILKRGVERDGGTEVKVSHILVCYLGSESCEFPIYTKKEALDKAQEIYNMANADNFADLATEHSVDPGSKDNGGEYDFFGRGFMVPEFEEAAFNAEIGQIVGPVETQFGYHAVQVTART